MPGSCFDGGPYLTIQGWYLLWFESEKCPFGRWERVCVCVCASMSVYLGLLWTEKPLLQVLQRNIFFSDSITTTSRAGGATQGGGTARSVSRRFPHTGSNKEAHKFWNVHLQAQFHLSIFLCRRLKAFPTCLPATGTPKVKSNPSCVRTHPSQIHFARNCLAVLFQTLTWHCWWWCGAAGQEIKAGLFPLSPYFAAQILMLCFFEAVWSVFCYIQLLRSTS